MFVMPNNRIAMWSGPRNISTALMYSFNNRTDTICTDEPLYSNYLLNTDIKHPGKMEIINSNHSDVNKIIDELCSGNLLESEIHYQKHMAHHLLPNMPISWISNLNNCILIRNPKEVIHSLSKKISNISLKSTGLPEQIRISEFILENTGKNALIIDSSDILRNPEIMLTKLCMELGINFDKSMLSWETGPKECDGIWSKYWYQEVWETSTFKPYNSNKIELSKDNNTIYQESKPLYDRLYSLRI